MTDRFKGNILKPNFTFYSMTINKDKKKFKSKPIVNKYVYCIVCGSNPIIKIDNAREYICTKCLPKYFKGKTNWNLKKK